ncbi:3885_t:CDS:2 [Ambispora leptoticha]|uniref:3885_t:CDS:1 n=1 Tax=Ambispora leptoticha TaxID=144679 RepID=A0A9N8VJE2_9GLOM|nr:3885_t:CDS:2 [Ambispora leptoticha]
MTVLRVLCVFSIHLRLVNSRETQVKRALYVRLRMFTCIDFL